MHRHIADMLGGAQHKADHIRVAMLIAQHLLHHKAAGGKVAVDHQLRRLTQHDLGHFAVDPTAKVAPAGLPFRVIAGVNHIVAGIDLLQQLAHLIGGSLAVIVQTNNDVPAAFVEACHQRGMLPEVFGQIHPRHMIIRGHQRADRADGIIGRAIVDQNDLIVILRHRLHSGGDLRHHLPHRMLGTVAGDHIRNFLHSFVILPDVFNCAYR